MSENEYTISQVSNITGVSTSAINYYVRLNIIEPPKKTAKTRSSFSNLHIEKIIFEVVIYKELDCMTHGISNSETL